MIILIGSEKGGVGKSTLATNLSVFLALQSKDVILVDADRQGTSSNWSQDRRETNLPKIESVSKFDNIRHTLVDLQQRYEYVIVDSQGRDSVELRTGLLASDYCLTPIRPSQADLDTIYRSYALMNQLNYTQAPNTSTEIRDAQECLKSLKGIELLNTVIYDRRAYRDALGSGKGVLEMANDKAIFEFTKLCEEFFK
jgi:chromosome partitioning protein